MPVTDTRPTPEQAMRRLRLDDAIADELPDAIEQAQAEAVKYLDGPLVLTAAEVQTTPRAILCTPDIISAQLLLVDALIGANTIVEQQSKRGAALNILRRHRNQGA